MYVRTTKSTTQVVDPHVVAVLPRGARGRVVEFSPSGSGIVTVAFRGYTFPGGAPAPGREDRVPLPLGDVEMDPDAPGDRELGPEERELIALALAYLDRRLDSEGIYRDYDERTLDRLMAMFSYAVGGDGREKDGGPGW